MVKLSSLLKLMFKSEPEVREPLDPNDPIVKKKIEMIRLYELEIYDVWNEHLCHYGFKFSDGSYYGPVGIVSIIGIKDELIENGLYRQAVKLDEPAKVISITSAKAKRIQEEGI